MEPDGRHEDFMMMRMARLMYLIVVYFPWLIEIFRAAAAAKKSTKSQKIQLLYFMCKGKKVIVAIDDWPRGLIIPLLLS